MKKKIAAVCLIACLAIIAISGAVLAYFTDNEKTENVFTVGNIDIALSETEWEAPEAAVPAIAYEKNPVVSNIGENAAWIKVDVTLSDAEAFMAAAQKHGITDLSTIFTIDEDFDERWTLAEVVQPEADNDTLTYSYYYNVLLEAGKDTGALFNAVTIPKEFNNADMESIGDDFTITITAHGMQDAGFDNVQEAFSEYVFEAKQ